MPFARKAPGHGRLGRDDLGDSDLVGVIQGAMPPGGQGRLEILSALHGRVERRAGQERGASNRGSASLGSPPALRYRAPVITERSLSGRVVLALMAKAPVPGQVKTRLVPRIGEEGALALHRSLLSDKLAQLALVPDVVRAIAFAPAGAEGVMREVAGPGAMLIAQRGDDLGARLRNVANDLFAQGAAGVILADSDTPTLPWHVLAEAAAGLESNTVVFGPAWDGGYYLVGFTQPCDELFSGITWSSRHVLSQSVAAARKAGRGIRFLASCADVDDPPDLDRLARELAVLPRWTPGFPIHTLRTLERLGIRAQPGARNVEWQTLATRPSYANAWTRITESIVDVGAGRLTLYGVVDCGPCVGILPVANDGRVVLVRQFRYVSQKRTWEMPTGGVKPGETLEQAARRELEEECGLVAGKLESLGAFETSKSIVNETAHLFKATALESGRSAPEDTEQIDLEAVTLEEALRRCDAGEIMDSMTVVALLRYAASRSARPFAGDPD